MDMLSSSPLMESFPSSRFTSPAPSPTRTETDLPLDVDQSFNSSMSISCAGDVSPTPSDHFLSPSAAFGKAVPIPSPEFLSPTPMLGKTKLRRPDPVPIQGSSIGSEIRTMMQPLASKRTFGRELSTNAQRSMGPATARGLKSNMGPPAFPGAKSPASKQRGGIPMRWSSSNEEADLPKLTFKPALARHEVRDRSFPDCLLTDRLSPIPSPQFPQHTQIWMSTHRNLPRDVRQSPPHLSLVLRPFPDLLVWGHSFVTRPVHRQPSHQRSDEV